MMTDIPSGFPFAPGQPHLDPEEEYIIRIDTRKEVTYSRYAQIKGYSQGRVSQLKTEGKLVIKPYAILNLELVVLEKDDMELNRLARRIPPELLHQPSYRQVGNKLAEILLEYEQTLSDAERQNREQRQRADQLFVETENLKRQVADLTRQVETSTKETETLQNQKTQLEAENQKRAEENNRLAEQIKQLETGQTQLLQEKQQVAGQSDARNALHQKERETWLLEKAQLEKSLSSLQVKDEYNQQVSTLARQMEFVQKQLVALGGQLGQENNPMTSNAESSEKPGKPKNTAGSRRKNKSDS